MFQAASQGVWNHATTQTQNCSFIHRMKGSPLLLMHTAELQQRWKSDQRTKSQKPWKSGSPCAHERMSSQAVLASWIHCTSFCVCSPCTASLVEERKSESNWSVRSHQLNTKMRWNPPWKPHHGSQRILWMQGKSWWCAALSTWSDWSCVKNQTCSSSQGVGGAHWFWKTDSICKHQAERSLVWVWSLNWWLQWFWNLEVAVWCCSNTGKLSAF